MSELLWHSFGSLYAFRCDPVLVELLALVVFVAVPFVWGTEVPEAAVIVPIAVFEAGASEADAVMALVSPEADALSPARLLVSVKLVSGRERLRHLGETHGCPVVH